MIVVMVRPKGTSREKMSYFQVLTQVELVTDGGLRSRESSTKSAAVDEKYQITLLNYR